MEKDKLFFWTRNNYITNVFGRFTTNFDPFENGKCELELSKGLLKISFKNRESPKLTQFTGQLFRYICCKLTEYNKHNFSIELPEVYKDLGLTKNITRAKKQLVTNLEVLKNIELVCIYKKKRQIINIIEKCSFTNGKLNITIANNLFEYLKVGKSKKNMLQYPKSLLKLRCNNNNNKYVFAVYDKLIEHYKLNKNYKRCISGVKLSIKDLINTCIDVGLPSTIVLKANNDSHYRKKIQVPIEEALKFIENKMDSGLTWEYENKNKCFKDFLKNSIIFTLKEFEYGSD